jgi:hypothetical protein
MGTRSQSAGLPGSAQSPKNIFADVCGGKDEARVHQFCQSPTISTVLFIFASDPATNRWGAAVKMV